MYEKKYPPGRILGTLDNPAWPNMNQLTGQTSIYPRTISFEDLDRAVFDWFNGRDIIINDIEVPAFFLSPEKWAEFKQQWQYMDSDHKVAFPYITVRRVGFALAQQPIKGRIPGKKFTTYKLPVYTPAGPTVKHYRVPQPIKVDLDYEIRVLTLYIADINVINETLIRHFASLQAYLDIDKHYMPMVISSIADETQTDNIADERLMHTMYSIRVHGYIIDEEEFEEKLGISDIIVKVDEDTN